LTPTSGADKFLLHFGPSEGLPPLTKHAVRERRIAPLIALGAALVVAVAACGDDPYNTYPWSDTPSTAVIYSLTRPELNIPTSFSFYEGAPLSLEAPLSTGRWDAALSIEDSTMVLLPPGALGVTSRAGITAIEGVTLGEVTEAPSDTLVYETKNPVPVVEGTIYVIRTGQRPGSFGSTCTYYSKMEPLEIDLSVGRLEFRYVTSPICNSRELVPPN